jgi:NarL family two-component system response regulator LiaR
MTTMKAEQTPIRVMTIDDHEIMRDGIRFVLLAFEDIEFVGEARRGEDAVQLCQEVNPEVVLVDMKMAGMDGLQTTAAIKQACSDVQVLILTSFHDPNLVRRAIRAGAVGYLLKDASKEDLAAAIRAAKSGQTTFSPEAAEDLLADSTDTSVELTDREREVLTLLAQGMSNKEIGKQLHRSPFTVRHHVSQLIKKLGAANRAEVAAIAVERGLI